MIVNTHLSFVPWWGRRQLRRVVAAQEACARVLVVGDLNMGPAVARRITGMRPLVSGVTFPAHEPTKQLDHVLARGDVGTVQTPRIHALPMSDHRAMSVDLV
jgi:endonuclease/exonuclease/phosphatase family metal-dependent hydrolase